MSLVKTLNTLTAARLGVRPEDLTNDFIRHRRASRKVTLDDTNPYGGRMPGALRRLTDEQVASALNTFEHMITEELGK